MKSIFLSLGMALLILATSCGEDKKEGSTETTSTTAKRKYIRYNANSPEGKKALASMAIAMDSMRHMECNNVLSWYYQGAMHWIPDTIKNNPFCSSYSNKSELKKAWDNCTHIPGIEINFLAWHRLYIWHLESIVRKLSGDENFALPYWAYTNTTDVEANRTMNEIFRTDPNNSLYEKSRYEEVNKGIPINGAILEALNLTPLMKKKDVYSFTTTIDNAPHGAMHNYIGAGNASVYSLWNPIYNCDCNNTGPTNDTCSGGLMANVPSAGFDPIFFLHHSNIDRIWQQWTNSANGKLITLDDLKSYPWGYVFFNADGSEKDYTPEDVIAAIYNVDYEYDDTPTPSPDADSVKAKKKSSVLLASKRFADTIVSKRVGQVMKGTSLSFNVANDTKKLTTVLKSGANTDEAKTIIVTMKVSFTREPKGIYKVFINLPAGQANDVNSDYFAGFMTFFGAKHHAQHMSGVTSTGRAEKTFIFEMTDQFAATNAAGKPNYNVSIVNEESKGIADITVESVSVVAK